MLVRVLVSEKETYNEIAFIFSSVTSAGAFMECLAMASVGELVFEVTIEQEKQEESKSRFVISEERGIEYVHG